MHARTLALAVLPFFPLVTLAAVACDASTAAQPTVQGEGGDGNQGKGGQGAGPTPSGTGGTGGSSVGLLTTGSGGDSGVGCDANLKLDSDDPIDAARAIGICDRFTTDGFGLIEAAYVTPDGKEKLTSHDKSGLGYGLLPKFGDVVTPREGKHMLVLSSGAARNPTDSDYKSPEGHDRKYTTKAPPGYPKESPSCDGAAASGVPHDSVALELLLIPPPTAKSLSFRSNFFTFEFPNFVCAAYNDFFVALMSPRPLGLADDNIAFDSKGNSISVNAGFLEVCNPQEAGGKDFPCVLGPSQLQGTGFDEQDEGSAATGWLQTTAPLDLTKPGEPLKIRFAIWDSHDGSLDSTVLIDDFRWEGVEATTETKPTPK